QDSGIGQKNPDAGEVAPAPWRVCVLLNRMNVFAGSATELLRALQVLTRGSHSSAIQLRNVNRKYASDTK
ncbi:unnamed protein product, partial [Urochloa humidicola]